MERDLRPASGLLGGRVVGIKANIATAGAPWSAGLAARRAVVARHDAHVTAALRKAGAGVLPGLNMDAAALGGATDNPDFGRTRNPLASGFSAGGSSGGSAAAIAAGIVDMALGTDTMGSVRIPASYCGVFGLKPSRGLVGRSGVVPLAESFDTVGPLTRQARDLWHILDALVGPDPGDPASRPVPVSWGPPPQDISGLRVGVPVPFEPVTCEPEILQAVQRTRAALVASGAHVETIEMPGWQPESLRRAAFLRTELEGAQAFAAELYAGTLPPPVARLLAYGRDADPAKHDAANARMAASREQVSQTLSGIDVLLMPTTPQRAFHTADAPPANQADFTVLANVTGLPALAMPVAVPGERPASVQFMAAHGQDPLLIALAERLEAPLWTG